MDATTLIFLGIGVGGTLLLAVSVLFGAAFDFGDGGGIFSLPALAGFLGVFGYAGAITANLVSSNTAVVGALVGLVLAVPAAWAVSALTNSLAKNTDRTPGAVDYVGATGLVITGIAAGGYGEVSLLIAGQPLKLAARADAPLSSGTPVRVVAAPSETLVVVAPLSTSDSEGTSPQ